MVVAAAGCAGSSSHPRTLPPLATTPAASTPTADTKSAELAAASQLVRRYFNLLGAATTDATAAALDGITSPGCACRRTAEAIRTAVRANERYIGTARITSLVPSFDSARQAEVLVRYD